MTAEWRPGFSEELQAGLAAAVHQLRERVDAVYCDTCETEKMADLHYLAHELVDREIEELVAAEPELEQAAIVDLREQVRRHVHRLIEKSRKA